MDAHTCCHREDSSLLPDSLGSGVSPPSGVEGETKLKNALWRSSAITAKIILNSNTGFTLIFMPPFCAV